MNIYSLVSIVTTVLTFLFFIGIVVWAYGRGRRGAFAEAANAPFAVPDETDPVSGVDANAAGRRP